MVTGVETAGLVLGSLPLVLAALQAYAEGIAVTKRLWKYREGINALIISLRGAVRVYRNGVESLLTDLVPKEHLKAYVESPRGVLWQQSDFDTKLKQRLGTSYDDYLDTLDQVNRLAGECMKLLRLDTNGKVQPMEPHSFYEYRQRLKFSLNKATYSELLNEIWRASETLQMLVTQRKDTASWTISSKIRGSSIPDYHLIKDGALELYEALRSGWTCLCQFKHATILRLDSRIDDGQNVEEDSEELTHCPFHLLFRYDEHLATQPHSSKGAEPWSWEEAKIQMMLEEPPSARRSTVKFAPKAKRFGRVVQSHASNPRPVVDLCRAISELQKAVRVACLSLPERNLPDKKYKAYVYPSKLPLLETEQWTVCSLRVALHQTGQLDFCKRLELAVILASSVLQLHGTPWLEDDWSTDDIYLIKRAGAASYGDAFIVRKFDRSALTAREPSSDLVTALIENQMLYALGVALIELCYQKTISELYKDCDGPRNTGNEDKDFLTAHKTVKRLAVEIAGEAGTMYSDAVKRCIRYDFDRAERSDKDFWFQRAVFLGVVDLLKKSHQFLTLSQS